MWIRLDCPNGHPVKVDEKFAGKLGKCPACGAKVLIPRPEPAEDISEDAILNILGPSVRAPEALPVHQEPVKSEQAADASSVAMGSSAILGGSGLMNQQIRICPSCKRKVSVRYQICPHCRTYMPISDIPGRPATASVIISNCQNCGVTSYPGSTVCTNCGESLE